MEKGFTCRPDICAIDANLPPTTQIKNIFCDSLVHDERALKFLVEVVGEVSIARMRSAAPPVSRACAVLPPPHFDDLFTLREARSLWPQKKNSKKRNFPRQLEIKHGSNSACFVSRTTSFSDPITRSRSASRTRVSWSTTRRCLARRSR